MSLTHRIRRPLIAAVSAAALVALPGTAAVAAPSGAPAAPGAGASPAADGPSAVTAAQDKNPVHDLKGPETTRQNALRQAAVQKLAAGTATAEQHGASKRVKLGPGKYVELDRQKTDKIFTILAEFGDDTDPAYGGTPGPLHNQIAKPDRAGDNSTSWLADYNQKHFQDLYFDRTKGADSVANYYDTQSSGRYTVDGQVSDWVKVKYNEARYGSDYCGGQICETSWDLVRDAVNQWTADQKAAGRSDADIKATLAQYDQWDRYDYDGDGNFNEPDGYIDHFQIVHAGEDESAGGGAQGTDAIWAHRWYAYGTSAGKTGPEYNKLGGTQIGDTGIWVGDYTMQPENGGLGVYAHEFGHDLGLPDEYSSSGDNSTGFWTLMSSGSWLSDGDDPAIGDRPGDLSSWDKLQLGWLNFDTAKAGTKSTHVLGYAEYNTRQKQAVVVSLPDKQVSTQLVAPPEGTQQWYSGSGDNLKNTLTRTVDLTGRSAATLSLKSWYDIEQDYDFLYTEASADGGKTWTALDGTLDGTAIPRDSAGAPALTGAHKAVGSLVYPLDAYAGKSIQIRFRYQTDGGLSKLGFGADAITVTADGATLFTDGAETADPAWTAVGFTRQGAAFTKSYPQYYIAENRQYVSFDTTLNGGPYNFGFRDARPDWVERYPYQNGLLIWQWDLSMADNNTPDHPGSGQILPIDAHPKPMKWSDGALAAGRIQAYDSTFTLRPTKALTLHKNSVATTWRSQPAAPVFDDHKGSYWDASNPTAGVKTRDTGTRVSILSQTPRGDLMVVQVSPSK